MTDSARYLTVALAVALQIVVIAPIGDHGLRIALSDLLLPSTVLTLLHIVGWNFRLDALFRVPGTYWWLLTITVAMTFGLSRGWSAIGEVSQWALVNKWLGWFVLLSYFFAGALLTQKFKKEFWRLFLTWLLYITAAVTLAGVLSYPILFKYGTLPVFMEDHQLTGLMLDNDIFGFMLIVAMLLCLAVWRRRDRIALSAIYLTGLWFTASRAAMFAAVAGLAALLFKRRRIWVPVLACVSVAGLAATFVTIATIMLSPSITFKGTGVSVMAMARDGAKVIIERQFGLAGDAPARVESHNAIVRQNATTAAKDFVIQNPLFGSGLGSFAHQMKQLESKAFRMLHNSVLWLVIDVGLVGAATWIGFLFACLFAFHKQPGDPLSIAMFAVMVAFMVAITAGEFLYQRHFWFLLGMSLAAPNRTR